LRPSGANQIGVALHCVIGRIFFGAFQDSYFGGQGHIVFGDNRVTFRPGAIEHDTTTPDILTSGEPYARRFAGPVGRYMLDVQDGIINRLLLDGRGEPLAVLNLGGGHAQVTPMLLAAGCRVCVQGSAAVCAERLRPLADRAPGRLTFVASGLWDLPFPDRAFDAVVAIRLMGHIERWEALLAEMARVCRHRLVIDFPPLASANVLEPLLLRLKRRLEGEATRPYFSYSTGALARALARCGFEIASLEKQFFLPMAVHRLLRRPGLSRTLESRARRLGLTAALGGPALLLAERIGAGGAGGAP
jgi:ubiquinone/menaquinone biosynthesis C-methylase UbiE